MNITFPGPDGQTLTVADTRREPVPGKPAKNVTVATDRRPASWILGNFRA
jgi:hypothetical protein